MQKTPGASWQRLENARFRATAQSSSAGFLRLRVQGCLLSIKGIDSLGTAERAICVKLSSKLHHRCFLVVHMDPGSLCGIMGGRWLRNPCSIFPASLNP